MCIGSRKRTVVPLGDIDRIMSRLLGKIDFVMDVKHDRPFG